MGLQLGTGKMQGKHGGHSAFRPMADINVTPMVDVMLVLLVIFMITAPMLTAGVPVDLPETKAAAMEGQDEPLVVSVNPKGEIFIQNTQVKPDELAPKLEAMAGANKDLRIFVKGDKNINYGSVMEVMGILQSAGFTKVGLVTKAVDEPAPKKGR